MYALKIDPSSSEIRRIDNLIEIEDIPPFLTFNL